MRICPVCQEAKPPSGYYVNRNGACRACVLARRREKYATDPAWREQKLKTNAKWAATHPDYQASEEMRQRRARRSNLWQNYRIREPEYEEMLQRQGGVCAICLRPPGVKPLSVDHDHSCCKGKNSCGKCIRGLLCGRCNSAIGYLDDSTDALRRALAYIEERKVSK